MSDWLMSVPAFIVAIGLLVAVHEYGHFWVARRMGVKVLRYSIGFGNRVWGFTGRKSGIEYWLSAIPLGGYVKMLDEREGEVAEADKPYAFNRQHPARRIAIVAAGPGVNFLFAVAAYWLVFMIGVAGIKPMIGAAPESSLAAEAGLGAGEQIVAIDDRKIENWEDLRLGLIERGLDGDSIALSVRAEDGDVRQVTLDLTDVPADPEKMFDRLGLMPYQPPATPLIADVLADSPASRAGLEKGDEIKAVDGETVDTPQALVERIKSRPGEQVVLSVARDGQTRDIPVSLASVDNDAGEAEGRLGAQIGVDAEAWQSMRTTRQLGPVAAIPAAVAKTWEVSALTVRLMARMVTGEVSLRNVSGPIQIASYAGQTASIGLEAFVGFLALVSVSLAVLNLLPIPVLDGGHLLYYSIEWIRGRPLSEAVQVAGQQVGMVALLMLMTLAFYNDILRLLG
ncbi:regulator of sigma E protease protein [Salinisphaera shabanensis E1L3A]|uniref:Zinc metalloprotease n=1 Tax=Salinisphaera shabanensis E1L3A TaxID=1033802 RepID=U2FVI6_9GAMM|nr:RIP metalloprotease RseP [Salinisphaera shabanensis]ERJ19924.1 regulator of sigma E protease protein [Salinisphaera shabanensis E1L3A]